MRKVGIILALVLILSGVANAATYYVRTDGSDTGCTGLANVAYDGSGTGEACAFASVYKGELTAVCGDTVSVGPGDFYEINRINMTDNCTSGTRKYISGSGLENTRVWITITPPLQNCALKSGETFVYECDVPASGAVDSANINETLCFVQTIPDGQSVDIEPKAGRKGSLEHAWCLTPVASDTQDCIDMNAANDATNPPTCGTEEASLYDNKVCRSGACSGGTRNGLTCYNDDYCTSEGGTECAGLGDPCTADSNCANTPANSCQQVYGFWYAPAGATKYTIHPYNNAAPSILSTTTRFHALYNTASGSNSFSLNGKYVTLQDMTIYSAATAGVDLHDNSEFVEVKNVTVYFGSTDAFYTTSSLFPKNTTFSNVKSLNNQRRDRNQGSGMLNNVLSYNDQWASSTACNTRGSDSSFIDMECYSGYNGFTFGGTNNTYKNILTHGFQNHGFNIGSDSDGTVIENVISYNNQEGLFSADSKRNITIKHATVDGTLIHNGYYNDSLPDGSRGWYNVDIRNSIFSSIKHTQNYIHCYPSIVGLCSGSSPCEVGSTSCTSCDPGDTCLRLDWRANNSGQVGSTSTRDNDYNYNIYTNDDEILTHMATQFTTIGAWQNYASDPCTNCERDPNSSKQNKWDVFVNPSGIDLLSDKADYRLKAGSPAINAGSLSYTSTTDFAGVTRDSSPDIGAYEYDVPACSDGIDNDQDGAIDYPADTGCVNANDNYELRYFFMRTDGNDTNCNGQFNIAYPGSGGPGLDCAWKTITKGATTLTGGDTLFIQPGFHYQATNQEEDTSGSYLASAETGCECVKGNTAITCSSLTNIRPGDFVQCEDGKGFFYTEVKSKTTTILTLVEPYPGPSAVNDTLERLRPIRYIGANGIEPLADNSIAMVSGFKDEPNDVSWTLVPGQSCVYEYSTSSTTDPVWQNPTTIREINGTWATALQNWDLYDAAEYPSGKNGLDSYYVYPNNENCPCDRRSCVGGSEPGSLCSYDADCAGGGTCTGASDVLANVADVKGSMGKIGSPTPTTIYAHTYNCVDPDTLTMQATTNAGQGTGTGLLWINSDNNIVENLTFDTAGDMNPESGGPNLSLSYGASANLRIKTKNVKHIGLGRYLQLNNGVDILIKDNQYLHGLRINGTNVSGLKLENIQVRGSHSNGVSSDGLSGAAVGDEVIIDRYYQHRTFSDLNSPACGFGEEWECGVVPGYQLNDPYWGSHGTYLGTASTPNRDLKNLRIRNCIIEYNYDGLGVFAGGLDTNIIVSNCTFGLGNEIFLAGSSADPGMNVEVYNSIWLRSTNSGRPFMLYETVTEDNIVGDYNAFIVNQANGSNIPSSVNWWSDITTTPVTLYYIADVVNTYNQEQNSMIICDSGCSSAAVTVYNIANPWSYFADTSVSDGPTNYTPLAGNPVINAGSNTYCPETDFYGNPRNDGQCDIGAVEYTGGFTPQCSDGLDNDGDGAADHPNDTGCTDANDNDERLCGDLYVDSNEDCDGSNLNNETCVTLGWASGDLACTVNCTFDQSDCANPPSQVCNNGIREGTEVCDTSDLNGETCVSQGYSGGSLGCNTNCTGYDFTGCTTSKKIQQGTKSRGVKHR